MTLVRFWFFLGNFAVWGLLETAAPFRPFQASRPWRIGNNIALMVSGFLLIHLALPILALDAARLCAERGWGILNYWAAPALLKGVAAFFWLDFVIYLQHRAFHAVPWLWRLHKVHHTDVELDASTGLRFHPVEILLSMLIKIAAVMLSGASFGSVLAFEIVLNATSLFNHADIRLPPLLEPLARLIVVTPEMHRVHHGVFPLETNSDFGFNLPWWDRWLGTYRSRPESDPKTMALGLAEHRSWREQSLAWLLALPFQS